MGKVKIETKKLEEENNRRSIFAKRGNGVLKKACELSILCDTDVAIIAFSPAGELLYYCNTRYDVRVCVCTQEEEEYLHSMSYQKKNKLFCSWVLIKICFTDQQWKFSYTCRLCLWLCGLFQFSYSKKISLWFALWFVHQQCCRCDQKICRCGSKASHWNVSIGVTMLFSILNLFFANGIAGAWIWHL